MTGTEAGKPLDALRQDVIDAVKWLLQAEKDMEGEFFVPDYTSLDEALAAHAKAAPATPSVESLQRIIEQQNREREAIIAENKRNYEELLTRASGHGEPAPRLPVAYGVIDQAGDFLLDEIFENASEAVTRARELNKASEDMNEKARYEAAPLFRAPSEPAPGLREALRELTNDIRTIAVKIQPSFIQECSRLYDICQAIEDRAAITALEKKS